MDCEAVTAQILQHLVGLDMRVVRALDLQSGYTSCPDFVSPRQDDTPCHCPW